MLQIYSSLQALPVHQILLQPVDLAVSILLVELGPQRVVRPLNLSFVIIPHLLDYFLSFLRAIMRFVVLLVHELVSYASLLVPFALHVQEVLILLQRGHTTFACFSGLGLHVLDVVDELSLLGLA